MASDYHNMNWKGMKMLNYGLCLIGKIEFVHSFVYGYDPVPYLNHIAYMLCVCDPTFEPYELQVHLKKDCYWKKKD